MSEEAVSEEVDRLNGILREINEICRIPSGSRHAYTHFQQDFDRIRALTQPAVDMTKGERP